MGILPISTVQDMATCIIQNYFIRNAVSAVSYSSWTHFSPQRLKGNWLKATKGWRSAKLPDALSSDEFYHCPWEVDHSQSIKPKTPPAPNTSKISTQKFHFSRSTVPFLLPRVFWSESSRKKLVNCRMGALKKGLKVLPNINVEAMWRL